jgi:hypothetical protein
MVKIESVRDCTEFQVFVLVYLYRNELGVPGTPVLTKENLREITPEKFLPDKTTEICRQLDELVENNLLADKFSYGVYELDGDGVIFARKYLAGLPQDKDVINKTPGEQKVKKFFTQLFNEIRNKSPEEIAKAILSAAIKYGSQAAMVFLVLMAQHLGLTFTPLH